MNHSASAGSLGQSSRASASEDEQWTWLPRKEAPDVHVDIPALSKSAAAAAALTTPQKSLSPPHPAQATPLDAKRKTRNMLIWSFIVVCIVVPSIVGPVYFTQVLVPRDRAAAEAAARAAIKDPVPPLPPMVPVTEYFYDDFNSLNNESWSFQLGNGLDRGWNFLGFGNNELQCYTSDTANVDTIPDPTNSTNKVLRLQAVNHASAVPCTDQLPFNQTTTQWTSGSIRSKSKRLFRAPTSRLPNTTGTDNCTSLFIEARMLLPAVKGTSARLVLLPEPQNQTMGAPRCEWTDECGAYGIWPASGEIDIMGHKDASTKVSEAIQLLEGAHAWRASDHDLVERALSWHAYTLEWNCDFLRWYVDGERVFGVSRLDTLSWPFDQPFYLGIGYAVGGTLVDPNVDQKDSTLLVDYVRAWYDNRRPPEANTAVSEAGPVSFHVSNSTAAASSAVNGTSSDKVESVTASKAGNSTESASNVTTNSNGTASGN